MTAPRRTPAEQARADRYRSGWCGGGECHRCAIEACTCPHHHEPAYLAQHRQVVAAIGEVR